MMVDLSCTEFNGKKDSSYSQICEQYVNLVKRSPQPIVIFDGLKDGPTIKDSTHKHRSKGKIGTKVSNFSGDKRLKLKKENFLSTVKSPLSGINGTADMPDVRKSRILEYK